MMYKFLIIMIAVIAVNAQTNRWGENILLGDAFVKIDSLRLTTASITSTLTNADVLYSGALEVTSIDGIYSVDFHLDELTGAITAGLYVRYYSKAKPKWTSWYSVATGKTADGLYRTYISDDAGTYGWQPCNLVQYKIVSSGTATATVKVSDYIK